MCNSSGVSAPGVMAVAVVQIGIMRVLVHERQVPVTVRVRLARRIARLVRVPVMRVVDMAVLVLERLVRVLVLMPLGEMEVKTDRHQHPGDDERRVTGSPSIAIASTRADERRGREIGAGARRAEMRASRARTAPG